MGKPRVNLVGQKFAGWLVIADAPRPHVLCRCTCGTEKLVYKRTLVNGTSKGCGCDSNEPRRVSLRIGKGEAGANALLYSYRQAAKIRGYCFTLTEGQFFALTKQDCYYCGEPPSSWSSNTSTNKASRDWSRYQYNGIDRICNETGYTPENCVTSCKVCNFFKSSMSLDSFLSKIKQICTNKKLLVA